MLPVFFWWLYRSVSLSGRCWCAIWDSSRGDLVGTACVDFCAPRRTAHEAAFASCGSRCAWWASVTATKLMKIENRSRNMWQNDGVTASRNLMWLRNMSEICCSAMIERTTACEFWLGHAFLSYAVLLAHLHLNILSLLSLEAKASIDSCRGFIGTCRLGHGSLSARKALWWGNIWHQFILSFCYCCSMSSAKSVAGMPLAKSGCWLEDHLL